MDKLEHERMLILESFVDAYRRYQTRLVPQEERLDELLESLESLDSMLRHLDSMLRQRKERQQR